MEIMQNIYSAKNQFIPSYLNFMQKFKYFPFCILQKKCGKSQNSEKKRSASHHTTTTTTTTTISSTTTTKSINGRFISVSKRNGNQCCSFSALQAIHYGSSITNLHYTGVCVNSSFVFK